MSFWKKLFPSFNKRSIPLTLDISANKCLKKSQETREYYFLEDSLSLNRMNLLFLKLISDNEGNDSIEYFWNVFLHRVFQLYQQGKIFVPPTMAGVFFEFLKPQYFIETRFSVENLIYKFFPFKADFEPLFTDLFYKKHRPNLARLIKNNSIFFVSISEEYCEKLQFIFRQLLTPQFLLKLAQIPQNQGVALKYAFCLGGFISLANSMQLACNLLKMPDKSILSEYYQLPNSTRIECQKYIADIFVMKDVNLKQKGNIISKEFYLADLKEEFPMISVELLNVMFDEMEKTYNKLPQTSIQDYAKISLSPIKIEFIRMLYNELATAGCNKGLNFLKKFQQDKGYIYKELFLDLEGVDKAKETVCAKFNISEDEWLAGKEFVFVFTRYNLPNKKQKDIETLFSADLFNLKPHMVFLPRDENFFKRSIDWLLWQMLITVLARRLELHKENNSQESMLYLLIDKAEQIINSVIMEEF